MTGLWDFYRAQLLLTLAETMQYRVALALQLLGKFGEPVVYLVVWSTVARESGGSVAGVSAAEFSAYFILWTLVRQATVAWNPYWMESRIRRGDYTPLLLRPVHPFHGDTAALVGSKIVELLTLIPTMVVLTLLFRPAVHLVPWAVAAFFPALALGFLLRHVLMYSMSVSGFWTTRVTAFFQLFFTIEFFLSGRIAPLAVLPAWGQEIARRLPFVWMFGFPLELALGRLTSEQALQGFAHQIIWLAASGLLLVVLWRLAVRHYTAVGG